MIAVLIINHGTIAATRACIESVLAQGIADLRVFLLDNGSAPHEVDALAELAARQPAIVFDASAANLGFAAGMNRLLERALAEAAVSEVVLLNSDTLPAPGAIAALRAAVDRAASVDMVAANLRTPRGEAVDSLGITLYRSTLASNRKREDEVLLGPSGGCALLTRRLLEDLRASHGECFDEAFFCYAEDTDLVLRARWLGYGAAYAADAVVYHEGSLSSGGPGNDFVLYHGIRNSLWWLVKSAPGLWFVLSLPWFVVLHGGIVLRHLRRGKARILWRLYRDAIKGLPAMLRKRRVIRAARRVPAATFRAWVEPRFYERDYVRRAWKELWQ